MAAGLDFSGMVPGLDFLQGLMKGASAAMPGVGQWVAPTLDPAELDKRISELRTVQFWLEQNAKLLATTIQALEVQRMTLTTLQTMNLPLAELRDALTLKPPAAAAPTPAQAFAASFPPRPAAEREPQPPAPVAQPTPEPAPAPAPPPAAEQATAPAAAAAVDPMQWWGALTQQFSEIAGQALQAGALQQAGAAAATAAGQGAAVAAKAPKPAAKKASARKAAGKTARAGSNAAAPARRRRSTGG